MNYKVERKSGAWVVVNSTTDEVVTTFGGNELQHQKALAHALLLNRGVPDEKPLEHREAGR